jgi:hypothetical protein
MSNYRVSALVLDHNLDNIGENSRFHWLSHLVTTGYEIETDNYFKPEIEVVVNSSDKNRLSSKQFTLLKKYVDGR